MRPGDVGRWPTAPGLTRLVIGHVPLERRNPVVHRDYLHHIDDAKSSLIRLPQGP